MGVFILDSYESFANAGRVIDESFCLGIERGERIETGASEFEHIERIQNDDISDPPPIIGSDRGQFALRIDDDNRAVAQAKKIVNEQARPFAGTIRPEQQEVTLAVISKFAFGRLFDGIEIPAKIDGR